MADKAHEPQRVKKKLPQNTEALLDELDGDSTIDAEELLKEITPNIDDSFKDMNQDFSSLNVDIQPLDLSGESSEDNELSLIEKIKLKFKKIKKIIINKTIESFYSAKYFIIWLVTEGSKKLLLAILKQLSQIKDVLKIFMHWSWKRKVAFLITFSLLGAISFGFFYIVKNKYLYKDDFQFVGSMSEIATSAFSYDPKTESETFYSSARIKTFSYKLKPVVVNLKRKPGKTKKNPMGFFEFVLDGSSGDVLVEVKSRESEIVDLVQRVIEAMDYETLDTIEGKIVLKETLKKELNKTLIEGALKNVQIQNIIINP